jgi:hypothetical protein
MKKTGTILLLMLMAIAAFSQKPKETAIKKGCGCRFQSINQIGLVQGESEAAASLQTINGIRVKQWFAGVGAGIDYYRFRGIPVFIDVRRNIFNKPNTPFIYADAGIHYPWVSNQQKLWWGDDNSRRFSKGLYTDFGIGYSLGLKNKMAFLMSAGFSHKQINEKRYIQIWCLVPPCPENVETFKYGLNRLAVKMGLQF